VNQVKSLNGRTHARANTHTHTQDSDRTNWLLLVT